MRAELFLFTKPAEPGRVKTRLVGDLTEDQTAKLHQAFLDDLLARLQPGRFDLTVAWALEDGQEVPESEFAGVEQQGTDLGERLYNALTTADGRHSLVGAVGSDHPEVSLEEVERGFTLLGAGVDVVLGPTDDGGYYFVGCRRESLRPELFRGIDWSTPAVFEQTVERARSLSLSFATLEPGHDVDTPADLERLVARLEAGQVEVDCLNTRQALEAWGLLRQRVSV